MADKTEEKVCHLCRCRADSEAYVVRFCSEECMQDYLLGLARAVRARRD